MEDDILQVIEEEVTNSASLEELKVLLLEKGFQERDVDEALESYRQTSRDPKRHHERMFSRLFSSKEVLDRVGYGFSAHQFINILFYQAAIIGGLQHFALFIVGVFNGAKSLLSTIISSFLQEYQKEHRLSKKFMSRSGILFGFSFFVMAIAYKLGSWWLFGLALLGGSLGVVSYGDAYTQLLREHLKKERMNKFLRNAASYGVLITVASLLLSGWLLETFPPQGKVVTLFGVQFTLIGFILSFMVTAIAFILSGYALSFIAEKKRAEGTSLHDFVSSYKHRMLERRKTFFKHPVMPLLLFTSILLGVVQSLGNSYYGIFIYDHFKSVMLGGFLNVAVIFAVAVLVSMLGPAITQKLHKSIGYAPMLVFGTMLIAIMPATAAWNPSFYAIGAASAVSVIGAAIVGAAQGLLARKLLPEADRHWFFANVSLMMAVPFIVLLPFGAYIAQLFSLTVLFKGLAAVLVVIIMPLYLILVGYANKKRW